VRVYSHTVNLTNRAEYIKMNNTIISK